MHCGGWDDTFPVGCCRRCGSSMTGVANTCVGCGSYDDYLLYCAEKCGGGADLPQLGHTCALYCAKDAGSCAAKLSEIGLALVDVLSTFVPGAQSMKAATRALKAGGKAGRAAAKKAFLIVVRASAKRMAKKFQKNLVKYMKQQKKDLKKSLRDAILEGGAEGLIAELESRRNPDLKVLAMEVAEAVDPTGFVGVVNAFSAQSCGSMKISNMPEHGLVDEVTLTKLTFGNFHVGVRGVGNIIFGVNGVPSSPTPASYTLVGHGYCRDSNGQNSLPVLWQGQGIKMTDCIDKCNANFQCGGIDTSNAGPGHCILRKGRVGKGSDGMYANLAYPCMRKN